MIQNWIIIAKFAAIIAKRRHMKRLIDFFAPILLTAACSSQGQNGRLDSAFVILKSLGEESMSAEEQARLIVAILLVTLLISDIIIKRYQDKDLMNQIRALEAKGEKDIETVRTLNEQIGGTINQEATSLQQGKQLYDQIINGGTVSSWRKKEFLQFIDYYTAIDYKTVKRLKKVQRKEKLTPHMLFFLLLKEMGYKKKEIARILGIEETSVNTLNTRTKPVVSVTECPDSNVTRR